MKKISLLILTILIITGCSTMEITGSGNIVSRQLNNTGFSSIKVGNTCQLEINQGSEYSVTVYCDDNISNMVEINQTNNELELELSSEFYFYSNITYRVVATMPDLTKLRLSGASNGIIKQFNSASSLDVGLSGDSTAEMQFTTSGNIKCDLTGASELKMEGVCNNIVLKSTGGSESFLSELYSRNADIELSGGSTAIVHLNGILNYKMSGGSSLTTMGNITSINSHGTTGGSEHTHVN